MFCPEKNRIFFRFVAALFRLVARFTRVKIEDSSGNRFASTAYFAKPGLVGGECSGGKHPGWNLRGEFAGHQYISLRKLFMAKYLDLGK